MTAILISERNLKFMGFILEKCGGQADGGSVPLLGGGKGVEDRGR